METLYKALVDMGPLIMGTLAPLALTSGKNDRGTLALGTLLSLMLGKMTFNLQAPPANYNLARESLAIENILMTSDSNRFVRLSLGAVYMYAAISFCKRSSKANRSEAKEGKQSRTLVVKAGSEAVSWLATFSLCFIGAVWLITGYYGQ
jgi:hypothetical protein